MLSAHTIAEKDQYLYVGLSNGKIFLYRKKAQNSRLIVDRGKDHECLELVSTTAHKGKITQLIATEIDGREVLISGSADRTIKLWEPKNTKQNKCFQTVIGHQGSILSMLYLPMIQTLVSSSTDGSMRIWKIDPARQLLLYPWFIEHQRCHEFASHKESRAQIKDSSGNKSRSDVWNTALDYMVTQQIQLFACDSEGSLYVFESTDGRSSSKHDS